MTVKDDILTVITDGDGAESTWPTANSLEGSTGKSSATVRKSLKALVDEGVIVKDESTGGYHLAPKRGRRVGERSADVIDRDDRVLAAVKDAGTEGSTKGELVDTTNLSVNEVYLSLYRLRRDDKVRRTGNGTRGARWVAA